MYRITKNELSTSTFESYRITYVQTNIQLRKYYHAIATVRVVTSQHQINLQSLTAAAGIIASVLSIFCAIKT